ncbi:MAG TPA: TlpA disulfide reductase family protein [Thermoanaerobaculia bacterium]|nr:TlpA disulfide reductase family protein [Thermoanaerobaculia bacterium]
MISTPSIRGALLVTATLLVAAGAAPGSTASAADPLPAHLLDPKQVEPISASQFVQLLEHRRGQVVLVNLWATWCIPCVQELPDLSLLQERYGDRGLQVIGVSFDDPSRLDTRVRPFFAEKAPTLISYLQTEADQYTFVTPLDPDWVGAMPTSFFIDRAGKVAKSHAGRMLYRDLEREVLRLLEQPAPDAGGGR